MATDFDNIVSSLNTIGNKVGDENSSSNKTNIDWSVDKYNDIIGWFTTNNKRSSKISFYLRQSLSDSYGDIKLEYEIIDVDETVTYDVNGEETEKVYRLQKIRITSDRTRKHKLETRYNSNGREIQVLYKNDIYSCYVASLSDRNFYITAKDGAKLYVTSVNNAYYITGKQYSQTFNLSPSTRNSDGVPFYCWYATTKNNKIYVGIKLNLTADDESKLPMSGWVLVYDETSDTNYFRTYVKETLTSTTASEVTPETNKSNTEEETVQEMNWNGTAEWENTQDYNDLLLASDSELQMNYWTQLYGGNMGGYSLKSHRSIIGLPLQFMPNVDMRVGSSTYGKQFMEDILYDMSIACIKPGGPVLNPSLNENAEDSDDLVTSTLRKAGKIWAYYDSIKDKGFGDTLKQYIFTLFKGGGARFYSFQSDYTHYLHYVNTLCHLFIVYLNIGEKEYNTPNGKKKYAFYSDDPREIETDGGSSIGHQFGWDNAVYVYYSPESQLSHTFSNSTMSSTLNNTLAEASNAAKEWGFFINAAGLEKGKGISSFGEQLAANASGLLGRLFGNVAEGVTTVLSGNNLSLPEIYADSETSVQHTFKIKLASPYGDPESVFLYVLRPLARLLAFSLPRQYGPNSYQSPFIIQAFSKGQFNCQLGIVTNLSITRCGNGGESHTIHHIPTELEVTLEIQDMYEKVFLSNEYFGNSVWSSLFGAGIDLATGGYDNVGNGIGTALAKSGMTLTATRLLFNNVGLIDFIASFCGFNLNQPTYMDGWTTIWNMIKNRTADHIQYNENDGWKFPMWERQLNDAYHDATTKLNSNITTIA